MVKVNTSEAKVGGGGVYFDAECDCVFMIESVDVSKAVDENPSVKVEFTSVASTVADQIGKKINQIFYLGGGSAGKFINLCCGLGIYNQEKFKADKEANVFPDLAIEDSTGLLVGSRIRHEPMNDYNTKKLTEQINQHLAAGEHDKAEKKRKLIESGVGYLQIGGERGFDFFALGDKEMDHVPFDATINSAANDKGEFLTRFGTYRKRGTAGPDASAHGKAAPKSPSTTKPSNGAKAAASNFGGEFV